MPFYTPHGRKSAGLLTHSIADQNWLPDSVMEVTLLSRLILSKSKTGPPLIQSSLPLFVKPWCQKSAAVCLWTGVFAPSSRLARAFLTQTANPIQPAWLMLRTQSLARPAWEARRSRSTGRYRCGREHASGSNYFGFRQTGTGRVIKLIVHSGSIVRIAWIVTARHARKSVR